MDIDDELADSEIWNYAKLHDLAILTKDPDFSNRIVAANLPPRIIHLQIGNMRLREFKQFIDTHWISIEEKLINHKLVIVVRDRIEVVE